MADYNCNNCPYCQCTNDFFKRWCNYWNKVVYLTDGCSREE